MASDRRSSMSSIRSAISRTSMGSQRPGTPPQIAERRPPSPLTQPSTGVPTLAPPSALGKNSLPPPMTPQRKPIQRQRSPLSAEAFSSPASSNMPGSFPDATPDTTQNHDDSPAPGSRSSKRLSSMSKLLPFKALRKSYDESSPQESTSPDIRPKTPGADSMMSSSKPSLRKRVSGTFWRRKSSLGMHFTPGDDAPEDPASAASPNSPRTNGFGNHETIQEDSRPSSPTLADSSLAVKKRKSGTFWRRTTSLTLAQANNAEKQGWNRNVSEGNYANGNGKVRHSEDLLRSRPPQIGRVGDIESRPIERKASDKSYESAPKRKVSDRKPLPVPPRTPSPPPQLPPFVGAGGGLGLDDDWLKNF